MSLDRVLDPLAERLSAALGPGTRVDDVEPAGTGDVPCVVLSMDEAASALVGVGRLPRGTRRGALPLTAAVDLADPVLDLGGGESLQLLSADRRTLTLPHGPLVRADGTEEPPLGPGDVTVDDGAPVPVVDGEPTGRQVRADPVTGTLLFGDPLPAAGTLTVGYHVGRWDTVTTRAQARLHADVVAAAAAAVSVTARAVAAELAALTGSTRCTPLAWGPVLSRDLDGTAVRVQRLAFRVDAEVEDPVLTSSGGVIARVAVTGALAGTGSRPPEPTEPFDVPPTQPPG